MPMKRTVRVLAKIGLAGIVGAAIGRHIPSRIHSQLKLPIPVLLSVALWILFSVYWSIAAKDRAPAKTSESRWSRQLHLILVNGALLLLVLPVPGLTCRFLPAGPFLVAAGLIVQAAFIPLAVWARRHLASNWSGEVRIAEGHELVQSGPYRFLRHPIYTSVLGMYCGSCLVSGEIHSPIALAIVTAAYWRKIRLEERALGETFGPEFDAYRRGTWALVPPLF